MVLKIQILIFIKSTACYHTIIQFDEFIINLIWETSNFRDLKPNCDDHIKHLLKSSMSV